MATFLPRLRDILQVSASALYGFLVGVGRSISDAVQDVANRFPSLSSDQLGAAQVAATQARQAGGLLNRLPMNRTLRDVNIPVNTSIPSNYRYWGTAEFTLSATGQTEYRTVVVDSSTPLTRGQIADIVSAQATTYFSPYGWGKSPTQAMEVTLDGVTIDQAQRRS